MPNRYKTEDPLLKFKRLSLQMESGCIEWQGWICPKGYSVIRFKSERHYAHRWIWEHTFGKIKKGLQLDHLCRNRKCVNLAHLEPVTPRINTMRGFSFSALNSKKTHCWRGHPFNEENTSINRSSARECLICRRARQKIANEKAIENRRLKRERNMVSKMFCDSI